MMQLRKLQLQHAADAAAIGAAVEKARGNAGWVAAGQADAALNGFTNGVNGVTVSIQSPPTSGSYAGNATAIQATVTQNVHTAFLVFLGMNTASPGAMAVAKSSSPPSCLYVMNTSTTSYPLSLQSNSSSLSLACGIYLDSTSKSIQVTNGSSISVTNSNSILVQGTAGGASLAGSVSPSPTYNSANQNDPLSSLTSPAFSSCTHNNMVVGSWLTGWLFPTYQTLNPGTYCGGLTTYYSHITLNPGLYIFTGGADLTNSTFSGTGVTFYATQGGGWGYSNFIMQNVTFSVSAPTSTSGGGVTGIVFFGDRGWTGHGSQGVQITGSTISGDGIWYVLNTGMSLNTSSITGTNYTGIVTDNLALSQSSVTAPIPNYTSLSGGSPYAGGGSGLAQ